jgi:hypothetical protein
MLVRALKVLDLSERSRPAQLIATAALDQPGDEDGAYGRGSGERQRDSAIWRKSDVAVSLAASTGPSLTLSRKRERGLVP